MCFLRPVEIRFFHTCRELDVSPCFVRDTITHHAHHQHALTCCAENGTRHLLRPNAGPLLLSVKSTLVRGQTVTVAQLPRLATFCVEFQRVPDYVNASSVRVERVDRSYLHSSTHRARCELLHVGQQTHITTRTHMKRDCNNYIFAGSGAETHGKLASKV